MSTKTRARPAPLASPAAYEADFHRWSQEQAAALRERRPADIDWENVAEEIESLGRSDRHEIESRLSVILAHLLKWQFQPQSRSNSWRSTLVEQRSRIARLVDESPSLASYPSKVLPEEFALARLRAAADSGLPLESFPEEPPYSAAEALDPDFFPGAPD